MIAVIAAMDKEVEAIVSILDDHEHFEKSGIEFDKGRSGRKISHCHEKRSRKRQCEYGNNDFIRKL